MFFVLKKLIFFQVTTYYHIGFWPEIQDLALIFGIDLAQPLKQFGGLHCSALKGDLTVEKLHKSSILYVDSFGSVYITVSV